MQSSCIRVTDCWSHRASLSDIVGSCRLGLPLPETALLVLQQEARFKKDQDELQMFLDGFNALESSIPEKLKPLLTQHLADLDRESSVPSRRSESNVCPLSQHW